MEKVELVKPQEERIDIKHLQELRRAAEEERNRQDKANRESFIESQKTEVEAVIANLPQKLEEAARNGQHSCELMIVRGIEDGATKEELSQHQAYGKLIKYLDAQGLTNVNVGFYDGEKGGSRLYVRLP